MILQLLYIDPGSGSYLVQVLVAALLGIVFFFRNIGLTLRHLLFRVLRKKSR